MSLLGIGTLVFSLTRRDWTDKYYAFSATEIALSWTKEWFCATQKNGATWRRENLL